MTITSLTFTIVNTYAPQNPTPASTVERKSPPAQTDDSCCEHKRPANRQNRFADAMMSALRELGFGGTAATAPATATATPAASTPAAPATPAAEAAPAANSSASVESAVQQFAHTLFQALRQSGNSSTKAVDRDERVEGHGHHRQHHHRHHGEGQGYGNMSQRLEALSQTFAAPAAATTTVAGPAAAAPAKNPLLDAFTKLFNTLRPASAGSAAATPATDMAEKLRLFLHTLAQALAPDTMGSLQRAQVGGMLNLMA